MNTPNNPHKRSSVINKEALTAFIANSPRTAHDKNIPATACKIGRNNTNAAVIAKIEEAKGCSCVYSYNALIEFVTLLIALNTKTAALPIAETAIVKTENKSAKNWSKPLFNISLDISFNLLLKSVCFADDISNAAAIVPCLSANSPAATPAFKTTSVVSLPCCIKFSSSFTETPAACANNCIAPAARSPN